MTFGCFFAERFRDRFSVKSLFDHFSGFYNEEPCSGRKITTVDYMDMTDLLSGKTAVLIYARKSVTKIDMDYFVSGIYPRAEMFDIFCGIYSGSFRKNLLVIIFLVDLLRSDVDIVTVIFIFQNNVKRKIVYMIPFFQFIVEITSTVGA